MANRVLIVDDDDDILDLLNLRLSLSGYEVIMANNQDDFIKQAMELKPQLIILDLMLGEKDGTEAYQELLKTGFDPTVPVVFLSALAKDISITPPQEGRHFALLAKPFDPDLLVRQIAYLMPAA